MHEKEKVYIPASPLGRPPDLLNEIRGMLEVIEQSEKPIGI
jgi:hypothetical protein